MIALPVSIYGVLCAGILRRLSFSHLPSPIEWCMVECEREGVGVYDRSHHMWLVVVAVALELSSEGGMMRRGEMYEDNKRQLPSENTLVS